MGSKNKNCIGFWITNQEGKDIKLEDLPRESLHPMDHYSDLWMNSDGLVYAESRCGEFVSISSEAYKVEVYFDEEDTP